MDRQTFPALVAAFAAAALLSACDRSQQAADGTTQPGAAGTAAATGNGTLADTGAGGPGGAGEVGPAQTPPGSTINDINRNTPDAQAQGKANAAIGP